MSIIILNHNFVGWLFISIVIYLKLSNNDLLAYGALVNALRSVFVFWTLCICNEVCWTLWDVFISIINMLNDNFQSWF